MKSTELENDLSKDNRNEYKSVKILEDIHSAYLIKDIISFINKKQKMDLTIYNKQLQKIIGVDLEDYKETSGKYKIIENGKGREYKLNTNILIFEGEYLNLKRNGKGKEFDSNGKLIFKGDYLNGKRNGKGKEFDDDGELKFEGEYKNGERNGKFKEYNYDGKLKFEGEYLNGEKNGKGKEYNYNGKLEFEGEYLNGKRWNGKVKEYDYYNGKLR